MKNLAMSSKLTLTSKLQLKILSLCEWPYQVKHCMIFQMKPCIWKLQQRTATAFITLISGRKNISTKTQQNRFSVVRINKRSFSLQFISYIIMPGSISIPKAKVLLLALHVHDSCFKMLAKKIFLSTVLIKLKPRLQTTKVCPSVYNVPTGLTDHL